MKKPNKGKGRPKGSKGKIQMQARELAQQMGVDPLEILLLFASEDWEALGYEEAFEVRYLKDGSQRNMPVIPPQMRLDAAKEATKYIYPTQKAVEFTGENAGFRVIVEDYGKK